MRAQINIKRLSLKLFLSHQSKAYDTYAQLTLTLFVPMVEDVQSSASRRLRTHSLEPTYRCRKPPGQLLTEATDEKQLWESDLSMRSARTQLAVFTGGHSQPNRMSATGDDDDHRHFIGQILRQPLWTELAEHVALSRAEICWFRLTLERSWLACTTPCWSLR